jgi:alkylation response protein AidB-like acyl-CoA dehydrogenase
MVDHDPRQQKILDEARAFAEKEIRPHASEFDKNESLPKDLIRKIAEKKYLAATFPEKYGGLELDPVYYGLFTEEIGKACCSTRTLITVHTSLVGETLLKCGTEEQKNKWLPLMASGERLGAFALSEPDIGSDARGIQTAYEKKGDRTIINGRKKWISFGDIADFFIVIAASSGNISAFIVERKFEGVKSRPIRGMLAGRASHIAEVDFRNVAVPEGNILGRIGSGFEYVVSTALDHGKYSIAWAAVAVAQEALEAMVGYARTRTQFGQKIHGFQLIQGMIADAVTGIHAARALCLKAGEMRKRGDPGAIMETAIAKYFASKVAMKVATDAVQVHGGNGCCDAYPVERLFREAKVFEIIEGTSQIHQGMIAKYGLRRYYIKREGKPGHPKTDD